MRRTLTTSIITASVLLAGLAVPAAATGQAVPARQAAPAGGVPVVPGWASAGQNDHNTHDAATERLIGPANVSKLVPRWTDTTGLDVVATPTVSRGVVYVPDMGGNLWAVRADTGAVIWQKSVASYTGVAESYSRTSPAVYGDELVLGGTGSVNVAATDDAYLIAVDASTGALRWKTLVASDPGARVTGSPVISDGVVYTGVSSSEEELPGTPSFRGSVVALSATTGKILWQTYTAPPGYTGNAEWGSTPVVDQRTGLLYVGTGNNYSVPAGVCEAPGQAGCVPPPANDYEDSVLALRLRTGTVVWAHKTEPADTSTDAARTGPDYDIGSGPNLYTTTISGRPADVLGVGAKSGIYWALNPANGHVIWSTEVGVGGGGDGILWGAATDGRRVYTAMSDDKHLPYKIVEADGQKVTIDGGSWAALDPATGRILWQTADPQGAPDLGFVSTANGVVYAGSGAPTGENMYALDAANGAIRWGYASGGSVVSGAAIVNGSIYWGSGDYMPAGVAGNDKLYAFAIPHP